VGLGALPFIIFKFLLPSIVVGSIVGTMFLARYIIRQAKKFKAHINDVNAHKGE
jgi:hypothetical protein